MERGHRPPRRAPNREVAIPKPELHILKVGGARLAEGHATIDALARHIETLRSEGTQVVLVHGGGQEIGALHDRLGVPWAKRGGRRITSEEGMPLVTMVLCGVVNKRVVARFVRHGLPALGVSGVDLGLLRSELVDPATWGRVGGPPDVDAERLRALLDTGLLPVVAPVCLGPDHEPVNVNADDVACALAAALDADSLDFASDIRGIRTEDGLARVLAADEIEALVARQVIAGGMAAKVECAVAALSQGVRRVRVGNLATLSSGAATEVRA